MKRFLIFLICVVFVFSLGTSICFAQETVNTDVSEQDAYPEITDTSDSDTELFEAEGDEELGGTLNLLFRRVYEYSIEHKTELLGLLGDAVIFILALLLKSRISFIKKTATETNDSQVSVVDVVNNMVDGYNALQATYDKYGATEGDRNRVVGALVAQNTAILEILTTVYVNSKNLPQGVKDLVNLKYANCLKQLENDEQLKAIVTSVRESIGTSMTIDELDNGKTEV